MKGMVRRGDEQQKPRSGMLLTFLVAHLTSDGWRGGGTWPRRTWGRLSMGSYEPPTVSTW